MPYLIQKRIDGSVVEQWEIIDKPLTIGRGEQADVRVKDERISRHHCTVAAKGAAYIVTDNSSTNGTWVNNSRVIEVELKANDKIRIGQTVIVFMLERPKGIDTIMGEIEAEGKGLKTYIGELNRQSPPPAH